MRFRERLLTALLVISTACAMSTLGRAQDFPMGTNLSGVSYWGNNWPFRDAFKCSSPWLNADWREAAAGEFAMDARGWITSLRPGQVARTVIFGGEGVRYPAGRYTVLYDGEGTLEYSSNVRVVESSPGRQVVQVDNAPADQEIQGGGVGLYITSIVASNPLRNLRFFLPGLETGGGYFHPVFLDRIRPFRTLRFTTWNLALLPEYESQTWAERPMVEDARWSMKGVPLEVVCALANELGADPWISICYAYSDEDMRQCAMRVRELLAPGLRVYVEYSNEVWNPTFPAADYARRRGVALNLGADGDLREGPCEAQLRFYSLRARQTFQAFEGVFPPERLVRVLATQNGATWVTRTELDFPGTRAHTDVLATGAYFGYPLGAPAELARVRAMDVQALMSELQNVEVPASGADIVIDSTLAQEYGLPFVAYEGGQHLVGFGGAEDDPDLNRLFDAVNRHPAMGDRYTQLLQLWGRAGGGLFMNAYDCERYDLHGRWGALEYVDQPRSEAPKYDALMRYIEQHSSAIGERAALGLGSGGEGEIEDLSVAGGALSHSSWMRVPWPGYNAVSGEARPAAGNFDGDMAEELVVGLSDRGRGYLVVLDDAAHARRVLQWIRVRWSGYNAANGESFPACGDLDGDGRSEIVVGLGRGSGGLLEVFRGQAGAIAHSAWLRIPFADYNYVKGETHPALGDVDGDGKADLVVGLGTYTRSGGYLAHYRSSGTRLSFAGWARIPWSAYNAANGATWPACGDVDGNGKAELAVGLGSYPAAGGWTACFGGRTTGFAFRGWYQAGWNAYNVLNGEIHPALGDVNGDGRADLLVGTGSGGAATLGLSLSNGVGFGGPSWFQAALDSAGASSGATWPTLGRTR